MSAVPQGMATTQESAQANLFDVTGPITINYSRSSIAGVPLFSYRDSVLDLQFSGTEITRTDTPIGEVVTVTLGGVVDAFVRTFSLLLPEVRLCRGEEAGFDTLGIETADRSGAFVPAPGPRGCCRPTSCTRCTAPPRSSTSELDL